MLVASFSRAGGREKRVRFSVDKIFWRGFDFYDDLPERTLGTFTQCDREKAQCHASFGTMARSIPRSASTNFWRLSVTSNSSHMLTTARLHAFGVDLRSWA